MTRAGEPRTEACHPEGYKCLGDPLAEALGDSMVATDGNYSWRDLDPGYHKDLLYRAGRVRKSLSALGLAIESEAAAAPALDVDEQAAILDDAIGPADFGEVARSEVMYSVVRALHEQGYTLALSEKAS